MLPPAHSFEILPATVHDLTAIHELIAALPAGATVFVAKGFLSEADARSVLEAVGVHLVSAWRTNMTPNTWADDFDLRGPQAH